MEFNVLSMLKLFSFFTGCELELGDVDLEMTV